MDTMAIKKTLIEKFKYDEKQVEQVTSKIDNLSSDIKEALENWIMTEQIASPMFNGYDVNMVLEKKKELTILGAFLFLDWLRREPEIAIKALEKITIKRVVKDK